MKKLSELTLSDLISMYNNYMIVKTTNCGSAWAVISERKADLLEQEIKKRIFNIDFNN